MQTDSDRRKEVKTVMRELLVTSFWMGPPDVSQSGGRLCAAPRQHHIHGAAGLIAGTALQRNKRQLLEALQLSFCAESSVHLLLEVSRLDGEVKTADLEVNISFFFSHFYCRFLFATAELNLNPWPLKFCICKSRESVPSSESEMIS